MLIGFFKQELPIAMQLNDIDIERVSLAKLKYQAQ